MDGERLTEKGADQLMRTTVASIAAPPLDGPEKTRDRYFFTCAKLNIFFSIRSIVHTSHTDTCGVMPQGRTCANGWRTVDGEAGDIDAVAKWKPQDATTNPSLLLASAEDPR
jgi:hypothetical protein